MMQYRPTCSQKFGREGSAWTKCVFKYYTIALDLACCLAYHYFGGELALMEKKMLTENITEPEPALL